MADDIDCLAGVIKDQVKAARKRKRRKRKKLKTRK